MLLAAAASLLACRARPVQHGLASRLLESAERSGQQLGLALPGGEVSRRRLQALVEKVRHRLGGHCDRRCLEPLNRLLFDELGYRREIEDKSLLPSLLPFVLEQRRGGCYGLGSLYLALGESLGLPLEGVLVPGHFFVRYRGGDGVQSLELLKKGRDMGEAWYRARYRVPPGNPLYLRGLRAEETLAVLQFNLGNAHRDRGELARALDAYRRVVETLPDLAEAQANLGLVYHELGDYRRAEQAYRRAERADPGLPGLENNLRALHREWHAR